MSGRAKGAEEPDDIDVAFAEIVAGLARDGVTADWPDRDKANEPPTGRPPTATALSSPPPSGDLESVLREDHLPPESGLKPRGSLFEPDQQSLADEEHFEPPEPPPLPRLRRNTVLALALLVLGVLLLVAPGLLGLASRIGTVLGLVAITGGIGWLVLRVRQGPPPDSGWDDGAQL